MRLGLNKLEQTEKTLQFIIIWLNYSMVKYMYDNTAMLCITRRCFYEQTM